MKTLLQCLFLATACLLSACAGGPAYKDMMAQVPAQRPDQGRIYFYRTNMLGTAIQPSIYLNGNVVGSAVPGGFFYVDQAPGNCEVTASTEAENKLTFVLDAAQTRYVRLDMQMGLFVGHVIPRLVDEQEGAKDIEGTKYAGPKTAPMQADSK